MRIENERHNERGGGKKADRKRGGKTTSGSGQAWSSPSPRGQWRIEKMEKTGCEVMYGASMPAADKG